MTTVAIAAFGVDLSDAWNVQTASDVSFQSVTTAADAYPEAVGDPLFWFDASDVTGWSFAADAQSVVRIPSKRGTLCLTTEATEALEGGWFQWTDGTRPLPPVRVTNEQDLVPGCALDFGKIGSKRGMVFADADGKATMLTGLGTVILVYGSQNGGGWLLGGGTDGYYWHRAYDAVNGTYDGKKEWQHFDPWSNPIFANFSGSGVKNVALSHDGVATVPRAASFNHGWEVLSLTPSDTTCSANGFGVGDVRDTNTGRSGGMKCAEALVYDRNLTQDEIASVEAYLQKKWFGRAMRGTDGNAVVGALSLYGDNMQATLSVPAGETLQLDGLAGGHGTSASLSKTGEGTLRLSNAERYGGTLKLKGGKLEWPGKAAPEQADLPHDLYLHFDASDLASLVCEEVEGRKYVNGWESQTEGLYFAKALRAVAPAADRRPELLENALGPGLHVLDFGEAGATGAYLKFTTSAWSGNYDEASDAALQICTVVAVVGAQRGGGVQILNCDLLNRNNGGAAFYDVFTVRGDTDVFKGAAYLDGVKVNPCGTTTRYTDNGYWYDFVYGGYQTPTYHVVARQIGGENAQLIGAKNATNAGGGRYAEILVWNRPLSESEVLVAQAYLSAKWLKRGSVGYATSVAKDVPDVQNVAVEAASEIAVGGNDNVRLGALAVSSDLVKTGTGTLTLDTATADLAKGVLELRGGALQVNGAADVSEKCELAANPAFHYDPSDVADTVFNSGTKEVVSFLDKTGRNGAFRAYKASSNLGWLATPAGPILDEENTCNGLPVLDFGAFGSGRWLTLCKPVEAARHVYAIANAYGGAFLLGSDGHVAAVSGTTYYDYHRGGTAAGTCISWAPGNWPSGTVCWNAVDKDGYWVPPDEMGLLEFHPNQGKGTHVSALCHDRNIDSRSGGAILGEVVVYDRELTEREKIATRNYLMRKWLGKQESELADLPERTAATPTLPTVKVAADTVLEADADVKAVRLAGEGTLTKTGAGALTVEDVSGFTGTIAVATGTLKLPYASQTAADFVADGRILHVDATQGLVTQTNASDEVYVLRMNSLVGDGVYAEAHSKAGMTKPRLMGPGLKWDHGLPDLAAGRMAVNMLAGADWEHYFLFMKDGETNELTNIRSVYWVIGSQYGGGFLLGGGRVNGNPHQYAWHRGTASGEGSGNGDGANQALVGSAAPECVRYSDWKVNGNSVLGYGKGAAGLSGDWDVVSTRIRDQYATAPTADGFAFDGRILDGGSFLGRCGRQWLGEVIVYNRRLTDEEDAANQAYLAAKWGFVQSGVATGVAVDLAAGTSLDCGGAVQTLKSVSGAGGVVNGTASVETFVADRDAAACPTFESLALADGFKVEIRNAGKISVCGCEIAIAHVGEFAGAVDLSTAVIDGIPDRCHAYVRQRDGLLYVKIQPEGLFIIVK